MGNIKNIFIVILFLVVIFPSASPQAAIGLRVSAKKCFQGKFISPPAMRVFVFDASKSVRLLELVRDFRQNSNPKDSASAEKMLNTYDLLERESKSDPSLYRSPSAFSGKRIIRVPSVGRLLIIAFGDDEAELTSLAVQDIQPVPSLVNEVVMNFSSQTECPKAKAELVNGR